jgi:hypothetical protein
VDRCDLGNIGSGAATGNAAWSLALNGVDKELWVDYCDKWTALLRDPQRYEPSATF